MSAFRLHIASKIYTTDDILGWNGVHEHAYTQATLALCKNWLEGKEWFDFKTSGSTGEPKLISIHRSQIEASATDTINFFNLIAGDAVLCPLSIEVVGGQMMLYRSMVGELELHVIPPSKSLNGVDTTIAYSFMPIAALQLFEILSKHPEKISFLNNLNHLLIGGSTISDALQTHIQNTLNCKVWHSFGMTETVSHIAMRSVHPTIEEAYTVFDDIEIKQDDRSCLKIKGAVTAQKWLQTNDIVALKNNKQFTYLGRIDFTINSGGIKIPIEPIEKIIEHIFNTLQITNPFIVCGIPDDALGEKVMLLIDKTTELSSEQIAAIDKHFRERLDKFQIPKKIDHYNLHYTSSGKINRKKTTDAYIKKGLAE
jgi:o-succinylbenzoate---CoA ligase